MADLKTAKQLKELDDSNLVELRAQLLEDLRDLRFKIGQGESSVIGQVSKKKRVIARILTELHSRQLTK